MLWCILHVGCEFLELIRRARLRCLSEVVDRAIAFLMRHFALDGSVWLLRYIVHQLTVAKICCTTGLSRLCEARDFGKCRLGRSVDAGRVHCTHWLRLARIDWVVQIHHWSVASECCTIWLSKMRRARNFKFVWMGRSVVAGRVDRPRWLRQIDWAGAGGRELVRRAGGHGFHFTFFWFIRSKY